MKLKLLALAVVFPVVLASGAVEAKGCLKGAAVGGVAGHVAGKHGVLGAAVGCAVGHHREKAKAKNEAAKASVPTTAGTAAAPKKL